MQTTTPSNPCLDELSRLQLERKALELEVNGYAVVEDALDPDLTARGLKAALNTFAERIGKRPDVETGGLRRLLGVAVYVAAGSGIQRDRDGRKSPGAGRLPGR